MNAINQRCLRAVTHYDVDRAQCAAAVEARGGKHGGSATGRYVIMELIKRMLRFSFLLLAGTPSRSNTLFPP